MDPEGLRRLRRPDNRAIISSPPQARPGVWMITSTDAHELPNRREQAPLVPLGSHRNADAIQRDPVGPEHRTTDVPDVVHLFPKEAAERALLRGDASIVEWTHADSSQEATALAELNGLLNASVEYILSGSSGEACRAVRRIFDATITHIGINLTSAGARAIARGVIHQVISRAPRLAAAPVHVDSVPIVTRRSDSPTQLRSARCRSASSLFRDRVGRRLSDYIGDRRVAKAKRPLDEGVSVTDVVERVGYLDSTSFIKKFKKSTGLTPGERHRR